MNSDFVESGSFARRFLQKRSPRLILLGFLLFGLAILTMSKAPALLFHDASGAPPQAATQQPALSEQAATTVRDSLKENAETIRWIENKGQLPAQVLYSYTIPGSQVFVERDRLRFEFIHQLTDRRVKDDLANPNAATAAAQSDSQTVSHSFVVYFDGANPNPAIEPGGTFDTIYNYFNGSDPAKWASNVRAYKELTLRDLYPGISLRLYSQANRQLEYDWIIEPGADYRLVNLRFEGADDVTVAADGSLDIALRFGAVHFNIPESYQVTPKGKQAVAFAFDKTADEQITFRTTARLDPQYALVIDPTLQWGTWFDQNSTSFDQYLFATAVDTSTGYIYCAGVVNVGSSGYLPGGGYDTGYNGSTDAIVYVLSSDGKTLQYATYYGTDGADYAYGLSLSDTRVFLAGRSNSSSLPMTTGGGSGDNNVAASFDNSLGDGYDGFVAVFPKALNYLTYATYLGASISGGADSNDSMYSIRALSDTSFVVSGIVNGDLSTTTPNYIVNAADVTRTGQEGYIAKFGTLNTLTFGTYVGGDGTDQVNDIQIMSNGRVAFAGTTSSSAGWPAQVNPQGADGTGTDGFVGTIPSGGSSFQYLDRIGGSGTDRFNGLTLDGDTLYWTGSSASTDFPGVTGNFQTASSNETSTPPGGSEAFTTMIVAKVTVPGTDTPSGYEATYFGRNPSDPPLSQGGTVGVVIRTYKPACSNTTYLMIFGARIGDIGASRVTNINNEPFYNPTWQGGAADRPDMLIVVFDTDLSTFYYSTLVGGTFQDYFGDTGAARGSNHLTVNGDRFTLGTTTHSATHVPQIVGDSTGSTAPGSVFDPTRNPTASTSNDVHIIYTVSFVSDDYGDAPLSYGTATASHRLSCIKPPFSSDTLRLGPAVDAEGSGNPSNASGATVDDTTATDDEDSLIPNTGLDTSDTSWNSGSISVWNNTGSDATLYGWIDFNMNGDFDPGERASKTIPSSGSVQTTSLDWTGLSGLVAGNSYLRLRLTTGSITMLTTPRRTPGYAAPLTDDPLATGKAPNGEIEDYPITIYDVPTSVELANFKAVFKSARAELMWRTAQETDMVGFYVWRRRGKGEWEKMTTDLIAAKNPGTLIGAKYKYKDKNLKPGKKYRYKLELVHTQGKSSWSDIVRLRVPKP